MFKTTNENVIATSLSNGVIKTTRRHWDVNCLSSSYFQNKLFFHNTPFQKLCKKKKTNKVRSKAGHDAEAEEGPNCSWSTGKVNRRKKAECWRRYVTVVERLESEKG